LSIRTKRNSRRFIAAAAAVAVAASSFIATSAGPAGATTAAAPSAERYSGDNRFATAAAVATSVKAGVTEAVGATAAGKTFGAATAAIIVNGRSSANGADGLAAASLAGVYNAPILLVEQDSIPAETSAALTTLTTAPFGVTRFIVVGGPSAVSNSVLGELAAFKAGVTASRVAGADRYETAINVALAVSASAAAPGARALGSRAILVVGDNWPDALAAGALAYRGTANSGSTEATSGFVSPILLNNGATLRADVAAALGAMNGIVEVLVVGGTTVIPDAVLTAIRGLRNANGVPISAVRAGGLNRYETAVAASASSSAFTTSATGVATAQAVVLANGQGTVGPWDALSAGPLAAQLNAALLLTEAAAPPAATAAWHVAAANTLSKVYAVGGTTVISDAAATAAVGAATPASPALQSATFAVSNSANPAAAVLVANEVTLSATPGGAFVGVLGNGFSLATSASASPTAPVGLTVSTSATLAGGQLILTGPSTIINGYPLAQWATLLAGSGFTLSVAASAAASTSASLGATLIGSVSLAGTLTAASAGNAITSGGETGGTLSLTFNTAVTTTSTAPSGVVFTGPGATSASLTVSAGQQGCGAAGALTCTFRVTDLTGTAGQLTWKTLKAATSAPEVRIAAGTFIQPGTSVPVPGATTSVVIP
jgi:putative cell wall-binding protein